MAAVRHSKTASEVNTVIMKFIIRTFVTFNKIIPHSQLHFFYFFLLPEIHNS
jgi:hypothetical protein